MWAATGDWFLSKEILQAITLCITARVAMIPALHNFQIKS